MADLPATLFADPVWNALHSTHANFRISNQYACRYPAEVAPFGALARPTQTAMRQLYELLVPGEAIWLIGEHFPNTAGLQHENTLKCLQMVLPGKAQTVQSNVTIHRLDESHAVEMLALTNLAFPGFFRKRTCEMGSYYGVRSADGELIAMAGERMKVGDAWELSAVCTHPEHRGKGFATSLMWQVIDSQRRAKALPWLHVSTTNTKAIGLYQSMGFEEIRHVNISQYIRR